MTPVLERAADSDYGLLELERNQCLTLLGSVPVGRLVYLTSGSAAVVPVTFVLLRDRIFVKTRAALAEQLVRDGIVVTFEADAFDARLRTGWSVIVVGTALTVIDPVLLAELAELPLAPWASGWREHVIRISTDTVTGRRVGRGPLPGAATSTPSKEQS